jgi:hypothetical protein
MLINLEQNFSKQVFGYFLAAKSDKEKKIAKKMDLAERDFFVMRCYPDRGKIFQVIIISDSFSSSIS